MTLAAFQETMKTLLMSPKSHVVLASPDALLQFLEQTELTTREKAWIQRQPFERLQQYANMVRWNVEETLHAIYPLTFKLLEDCPEIDLKLVTDYIYRYPNPGYRMISVAETFPEFLAEQESLERFPFISELALYEWAEAELLSAPNPLLPEDLLHVVPQTPEELQRFAPVMNPVSRLLSLTYPIPTLIDQMKTNTPESLPQKDTLILIYRYPGPFHCGFFELNPILVAWLSVAATTTAHEKPLRYTETLVRVAEQLSQVGLSLPEEKLYQGLRGVLGTLFEKRILLGSVDLTRKFSL